LSILTGYYCEECGFDEEFYGDGEGPIICPACRSCDSIKEEELTTSYRSDNEYICN